MADAGFKVDKETPNLLLDGSNDRPADILLENRHAGFVEYICYDVSVTGYHKPLAAVEKRKNDFYLDRCKNANLKFVPLAINSLGRMSPSFVELIKTIGSQLSIRRAEDCSVAEAHNIFANIQYDLLLTTADWMRSIALSSDSTQNYSYKAPRRLGVRFTSAKAF